MNGNVVLFPAGQEPTEDEFRQLRVLELEIEMMHFDNAAESAAKMARECVSMEGKWRHGEVAAYFRRHAIVVREELDRIQGREAYGRHEAREPGRTEAGI
jgi:hypothetical protein